MGLGLEEYKKHVGSRTTCHVVSEQVVAEDGLSNESMLIRALKSTPMMLWMPPLAWGNYTYYSRYVGMLLGCTSTDGLELTRGERRRVVLLRPSVSYAMWKYFRPCTRGGGVYVGRGGSGASWRKVLPHVDSGAAGGNFEDVLNSGDDNDKDDEGEEFDAPRSRPGVGTTGFKFALLAMGLCSKVKLYGFEDDPRNEVDSAGGHYFNKKHSQEAAYNIPWERQQLRQYENLDCVCLVPTHKN